jgi:hypothetical protein
MKNIHILPTLQPSRLWFHKLNRNLGFSDLPMEYNGSGTWVEGRNIYITSDEEIKEGDWVTNGLTIMIANLDGQPTMDDYHPWKKIILTTDQDLIKDGVQAIDDEFLEWFVKNPSCEFVEINKYAYAKPNFGNYKIIIPKEEHKQEHNKYLSCCRSKEECHCKEEPKQETGKEVADYIDRHIVEVLVEVAKQKMYSEEDMKLAFETGRNFQLTGEDNFNELIEKLKK